jgi:hypothetical protein
MAFEQLILEDVVDEFGRRVVIALYLVADDIYLMFHFVLRILATENDICQQVDSTREMFLLDGSIKSSVFLVGESIQVATNTLQTIKNLNSRTTLGPFETHVFAEVGDTLFAWLLMA